MQRRRARQRQRKVSGDGDINRRRLTGANPAVCAVLWCGWAAVAGAYGGRVAHDEAAAVSLRTGAQSSTEEFSLAPLTLPYGTIQPLWPPKTRKLLSRKSL